MLVPGQEYLKTLFEGELVHFYRMDKTFLQSTQAAYTVVEVQNCIGTVDWTALSNLDDETSTVTPEKVDYISGAHVLMFRNPIKEDALYLMVEGSSTTDQSKLRYADGYGSRC